MRTVRVNAWNAFKNEMKICGVENRESHPIQFLPQLIRTRK